MQAQGHGVLYFLGPGRASKSGPNEYSPSLGHFPPLAWVGSVLLLPEYGSLGDACLPISATALGRYPSNRGRPAAPPWKAPQEPALALCGFGEHSCWPGGQGGPGRRAARYLSLGELHGVGQQEPADVLRAGRRGERAPVGVVAAEVHGQHVPDVKAVQNGALS